MKIRLKKPAANSFNRIMRYIFLDTLSSLSSKYDKRINPGDVFENNFLYVKTLITNHSRKTFLCKSLKWLIYNLRSLVIGFVIDSGLSWECFIKTAAILCYEQLRGYLIKRGRKSSLNWQK